MCGCLHAVSDQIKSNLSRLRIITAASLTSSAPLRIFLPLNFFPDFFLSLPPPPFYFLQLCRLLFCQRNEKADKKRGGGGEQNRRWGGGGERKQKIFTFTRETSSDGDLMRLNSPFLSFPFSLPFFKVCTTGSDGFIRKRLFHSLSNYVTSHGLVKIHG